MMRTLDTLVAGALRWTGRGGAITLLMGSMAHAEVTEGHRDYLLHCASCHGVEGHGDGPVAAALKSPPSDLSVLSAANGGSFPETVVFGLIDGRASLAAHGARDMPIWGTRFGEHGASESEKAARIGALIRYLEQLQRPAAP